MSEVEFRGEDGTRLARLPGRAGRAGRVPAALILSGSGPLDRNSNMAGQALNVANALTDVLTEQGIATLRYDKRGVGGSEGDYLATGFDTETSDAASALAWLGDRAGDRRAGSVGVDNRSQLSSSSPAVAGVVAGAAGPGDEVMQRQSDRIAATLTGLQESARWFLRRQERHALSLRNSTGDVVRIGRQRLPARWFREYMGYDPAGDLAGIRCPVLAITGRNDVQVEADDVERIGELVGGLFTGRTPERLTHLLRTHPRPGLGDYATQLKRPVDPEVLAAVATWLSRTSCGPAESTA